MNTPTTLNDALGSGLSFPIRTDATGGLTVSRYDEKVRQAILMILSTARGERVMRPEFGCDIHAFVFTTLDSTNLTLIKSAVLEALVRWEPRIEVLEVGVTVESAGEGKLGIGVRYRVRHTNFQENLVFPFYLQTAA